MQGDDSWIDIIYDNNPRFCVFDFNLNDLILQHKRKLIKQRILKRRNSKLVNQL